MSRRLAIFLILWPIAFVVSCIHRHRPSINNADGVGIWMPRGLCAPPSAKRGKLDLQGFGGVGNGETDDTGAFEAAAVEIERRGGWRLKVGDGVWITRPFNLTSYMTLFLDEDAAILGVEDEQNGHCCLHGHLMDKGGSVLALNMEV